MSHRRDPASVRAQKLAAVTAAEALLPLSAGRISRGLDKGEFELHYQPKVDLRDGRVTGVEALVRWRHPELGLLGPDRFVPLAESSGLIVDLGAAVIAMAAQQAADWSREVGPGLRVWVNVAAAQLADPVGLERTIISALDDAGVGAPLLGVELTESTLLQNLHSAGDELFRLRQMGVQLALDDFGTGYSSLAYLRRLPVDVVKVDRSFVSGVGDNLSDAAIVQAIIGLAHTLGLVVVAEGVESMAQLAELAALDADRAQGYLISRPLPADKITPLLKLPWCGVDVMGNPRVCMSVRGGADPLPGGAAPRSHLLLSALDALGTPVVVSDRAGILYVNSAFEQETGFSAEAVVGRQYEVIDSESPQTLKARALFFASIESRKAFGYEVDALRADGSTYPCEVTSNPVANASGVVSHWLCMRRDVSAQHALQRQIEQQLAMREMTGGFAAACLARPLTDPVDEAGLKTFLSSVADMLGATRCFMDLLVDDGTVVATEAAWGAGGVPDVVSRSVALDDLPHWRGLVEHEAIQVTVAIDGGEPPRRAPWELEQEAVTGRLWGPQIIAPMRVNGRSYGALGVSMHDGAQRVWRPEEIDFVRSIADTAANLSDRRFGFRQAEARRAMSEFQLRLSQITQARTESVMDTVITLLPQLAALMEVGAVFIDVVDEVAQTYRPLCTYVTNPHDWGIPGATEDRLSTYERGAMQKLWGPEGTASPPYDPRFAWFARLAAMEPVEVDDTRRLASLMAEHPAGPPIGRAFLYVPFAVHGRFSGVLGLGELKRPRRWQPSEVQALQVVASTLAAALEREQAEQELRASEGRFRLLSEMAADLIMVSDGPGRITYASPSSHEILGYRPDELVGRTVWSLVHPDDVELARANRHHLVTAGRSTSEVRIRHADGRWLWVASSLRGIVDVDGSLKEVRGSMRDVSDRRALQDELASRATTDQLTGLVNRAELQRHLDDGALCDETALMVIDLDGFKAVNDKYGHAAGDQVLRAVAARLSSVIRASDVVSRFGGDEFVVLCRNMGHDEAVRTAQRIVGHVGAPLWIDGHQFKVGVSVGVAIAASGPVRGPALIRVADAAMYEAKRSGKRRVKVTLA